MRDPTQSSNNSSNSPATLAADLLRYYSFELSNYTIEQQIEIWLEYYPDKWLPVAIIEALYQGRYKVISVEQILEIWHRREQIIYHFNHEFERLVCGNLSRSSGSLSSSGKAAAPLPKPTLSYRKLLLELPSLRAASRLERLSEIPSIKAKLSKPFLESLPSYLSGASHLASNGAENHSPESNGLNMNGTASDPLLSSNPERMAQEANGNEELNGAHVEVARPRIELPNFPTALPTPEQSSFPKVSDRDFQEFKEGVTFGLSSGLVIQALNPRFRLEFSRYYCPNWLDFLNSNASLD